MTYVTSASVRRERQEEHPDPQAEERSTDTTWKAKVLTREQPFLDGADKEKWLERKAAYKELRSAGNA